MELTIAIIAAVAVVFAAIIGAIALLRSGSQQRSHQEKVARRDRLAPVYRDLIQICQDMQRVASRLGNNPAQEVLVAGDRIREVRQRLDAIIEPDVKAPRDDLQDVLNSLTTW